MLNVSTFSKRQLFTLLSFAFAEFFNAICVSLQAPFFPAEAEQKGATATEYGCVFGVFELVVFLISPWYGKNLKEIGPKRLFFCGIITSATCSIFFGLLDEIQGHLVFISLAFLIRIIEAMGNAAFLTAGFAIIANEFPNNIASTFASLETFFGLGLIAGPTLGGILYELGGFPLPFISVGTCLFACAIFTRIALPAHDADKTTSQTVCKLRHLLQINGLLVCSLTIVTTTLTFSFLSATLEPHIRQFSLTAIQVGLVFIVNGAVYGITAPAWGWICDRKYVQPKVISILGGLILIVGVSLIGPIPLMPFKTELRFIILGLVLHGLSIGARLVSSFTDALRCAIASGMPNSIETYGVISALWTSSVALGSFIGPTISGILYDTYGFPKGSLSLVIIMVIMVIIELWSFIRSETVSIEDVEKPKEGSSCESIPDAIRNSSRLMEHNVGIGSDRVLNLIYNSNPNLVDIPDETTPLVKDNEESISKSIEVSA